MGLLFSSLVSCLNPLAASWVKKVANFQQRRLYVLKIRILPPPLNLPKLVFFSPKLCIFGRKYSDNFPISKHLGWTIASSIRTTTPLTAPSLGPSEVSVH